jgi:hypothetical protein
MRAGPALVRLVVVFVAVWTLLAVAFVWWPAILAVVALFVLEAWRAAAWKRRQAETPGLTVPLLTIRLSPARQLVTLTIKPPRPGPDRTDEATIVQPPRP